MEKHLCDIARRQGVIWCGMSARQWKRQSSKGSSHGSNSNNLLGRRTDFYIIINVFRKPNSNSCNDSQPNEFQCFEDGKNTHEEAKGMSTILECQEIKKSTRKVHIFYILWEEIHWCVYAMLFTRNIVYTQYWIEQGNILTKYYVIIVIGINKYIQYPQILIPIALTFHEQQFPMDSKLARA